MNASDTRCWWVLDKGNMVGMHVCMMKTVSMYMYYNIDCYFHVKKTRQKIGIYMVGLSFLLSLIDKENREKNVMLN